MKQHRLLLLGLALALLLTGCSAQAHQSDSSPEQTPTWTSPESEFVPLPAVEPSESVLPEPDPIPAVPTREPEEGGYFDNALLVGDSIMEGIRQYVAVRRQEGEMLGSARFVTTTMGISLADLVGDRDNGVRFSYQGEEKPLEDIVAETAPRRVFLLLGLNDLASAADPVVEDVVNRYTRLIMNLRSACPGVEFIIITVPPKVASQWLPDYTANRHFGNELIKEFVTELKLACSAWNIPYVDAYESLKNEGGALPDDYCRDGYIHLSHQGAAVVVEALNAFAESR